MALTQTLLQLKTRVREEADMENSDFISDSELLSYINSSYAELYDLLVETYDDYYLTSAEETIAAGTSTLTLPATFYKLRGVDLKLSTNDYAALSKFNFNERNRLNSANFLFGSNSTTAASRYRLMGNTINLEPSDNAAGTYKVWYTPAITLLSTDTDTVDGVNGWEEYIIVDAAIKCLSKEESSTTVMERRKEALTRRIQKMASERDSGSPDSVQNVRRNHLIDGWDWDC